MNKPPLDAWRFDETVDPKPKIIWTAAAIAQRINTSPDFVRDTLAKHPQTPIKRVGGRFCVIESDLMAFFERDPTQTH